ncbi:hypothetical protein SAY86_018291 [Trapa natans]|uniref:Uncharacterized protein n=1 Tax=Trapa natans TaxID=22666 RepID=A0AAN7LIU9_TRANT|nr:hypothetical protein SAY86_018291 [Trapa natans]
MVKLASARESRMYGPWRDRNRSEYINAGLYVFSAIVLLGGFLAELSRDRTSGLVIILIALAIILVVNVHDLVAHLAGIDCRLPLIEFDLQLAFVEFAVPLVQAVGSFLMLLGVLFLFLREEKGYGYFKLEKHALKMLVAGPVLWLLGSIHNSCQVYESADGHVQVLQQSVHIPFLMGSLLFVVGAIINIRDQSTMVHHGMDLLGRTFTWFSIFGSSLLVIGGLGNLVKVFKMQKGELRLEKLRGGAHELLIQEREAQVPLILEGQRRRQPRQAEEAPAATMPAAGRTSSKTTATPYKDVLVGQS